MIFFSFFWW